MKNEVAFKKKIVTMKCTDERFVVGCAGHRVCPDFCAHCALCEKHLFYLAE